MGSLSVTDLYGLFTSAGNHDVCRPDVTVDPVTRVGHLQFVGRHSSVDKKHSTAQRSADATREKYTKHTPQHETRHGSSYLGRLEQAQGHLVCDPRQVCIGHTSKVVREGLTIQRSIQHEDRVLDLPELQRSTLATCPHQEVEGLGKQRHCRHLTSSQPPSTWHSQGPQVTQRVELCNA